MRKITLTLFLLCGLISACQKQNNTKEKPNVLFIAIDDLNSCLEGMDGEVTIPTPNINKLAEIGVLFTNAHCAAPACNPSRVSVMTGLAPYNTGVYMNTQDWRKSAYLKDRITLPQHFKNNGYETLGGGKLYHAASLSEEMVGGYIDPRPWDAYYPSKDKQMPDEIVPEVIPENGNPAFYNGFFDWAQLDIETAEMADAKVVNWASKELSVSHDEPLFLAVGIYRPHIPWYTPKKYFEKYPIDTIELPEVLENDLADVPVMGQKMARRSWHKWIKDNSKWKEAVQAYKASVSFADDMVGELLSALENGPLSENTIVVLWSDHGYHLGQKEHWEKFALWELTTRVPFIVSVPGKFSKGQTCNQPVSLLDIYPTLNELCNIPSQDDFDGETIVPLLKTPSKKTERAVVCTQKFKNHSVRSEKWRYIRYEDGSEELYDQANDPKDFYNLAGKEAYKDIIKKLALRLPNNNAAFDQSLVTRKKNKK